METTQTTQTKKSKPGRTRPVIGPTFAYKYRILSFYHGDEIYRSPPPELLSVFIEGSKYYNAILGPYESQQISYREICNEVSAEVRAADADYLCARRKSREYLNSIKQNRARARKRLPLSEDERSVLKALDQDTSEKWKVLKAARKLAWATPEAQAWDQRSRKACDAMRKVYREESKTRGIHWGTGERIEKSAEQAYISRNKLGKPPKFKPESGETGLVAYRVQPKQKAVTGRDLVCSAEDSKENRFRIDPRPPIPDGLGKRQTKRFGVKRSAEIALSIRPLVKVRFVASIHREIPLDAQVLTVTLTAKKVPSGIEYYMVVVCEHPRGEVSRPDGIVTVKPVFRRDGGQTVAAELTDNTGKSWELVLPKLRKKIRTPRNSSRTDAPQDPGIRIEQLKRMGIEVSQDVALIDSAEALEFSHSIQSERDKNRDAVAEEIYNTDGPEEWRQAIAGVLNWKRIQKFYDLRDYLLENEPFEGSKEILYVIEAYLRRDKHLNFYRTGVSGRAQAQRRETYRVLAAQLAKEYGTVIIDAGMANAEKVRLPKTEDDRGHLVGVQNLRFRVCPSEIKDSLKKAFKKRYGDSSVVENGKIRD